MYCRQTIRMRCTSVSSRRLVIFLIGAAVGLGAAGLILPLIRAASEQFASVLPAREVSTNGAAAMRIAQTQSVKGVRRRDAPPASGSDALALAASSAQSQQAECDDSHAQARGKTILLWQHRWEDPSGPPYPITAKNWSQACEGGLQCTVSTDRSLAGSADALVLSWRFTNISDLPPKADRKAFQRYVFYAVEPPTHTQLNKTRNPLFENYFNWTMSYRLDSDIYYPYGRIEHLNEPLDEIRWKQQITKAIQTKTKLAVAVISQCLSTSGRFRVLEALKEHAAVDTFGGCFGQPCPATPPMTCRATLERDYFFFIAFENSLCKDYVTEKTFFQLEVNLVPVVFSRNSTNAAGIPNDAFIAVDDFESLSELGAYMEYLACNSTAFIRYFRWKQFYRSVPKLEISFDNPAGICPMCSLLRKQAARVQRTDEVVELLKEIDKLLEWSRYYHGRQVDQVASEIAFCPLCVALHNDSLPAKVLPDVVGWWVDQAQCRYTEVVDNVTMRITAFKPGEDMPWVSSSG